MMVSYSHLFKNFPQFVVIHIVKGFSIVNAAELEVFFFFFSWNSLAFYDPTDVGNLISDLSAFSKSSLNISVHILLKSSLENLELVSLQALLACKMSEIVQ